MLLHYQDDDAIFTFASFKNVDAYSNKRLSNAKNQLSVPGSFFNQFVTYVYIYIH